MFARSFRCAAESCLHGHLRNQACCSSILIATFFGYQHGAAAYQGLRRRSRGQHTIGEHVSPPILSGFLVHVAIDAEASLALLSMNAMHKYIHERNQLPRCFLPLLGPKMHTHEKICYSSLTSKSIYTRVCLRARVRACRSLTATLELCTCFSFF
jgi:hypothetical protein